jgi:hypothetical protein
MAKGLYLTSDGQVLVEYGKRRRVSNSAAHYKANSYNPTVKTSARSSRGAREELPTLRPEDR